MCSVLPHKHIKHINDFIGEVRKEIRFVGRGGGDKAGDGRELPESDEFLLNSDSHFLAGDLRQIT